MPDPVRDPDEDGAFSEAMWENVRLGYFEVVGTDDTGDPLFRVTEKGIARVREMIQRAGGPDA